MDQEHLLDMWGMWVCRIQSPNKSIRQWRKAVQAEATPPSLVNPIDAEDAMAAAQSGQSAARAVEELP